MKIKYVITIKKILKMINWSKQILYKMKKTQTINKNDKLNKVIKVLKS